MWIIVVGATIIGRVLYDYSQASRREMEAPPEGDCQVVQVLDSVTLIVAPTSGGEGWADGDRARVRLLGIESPPRAWESEAEALTRSLVDRERVHLRLDRRRIAHDGVFLAYVLVDGRLLNAELVRRGLARAATHPTDSGEMARQLISAESEARGLGLGIWTDHSSVASVQQRK
jgi:endonuclease YncB( thermonuclease family)